MAARLRQRWREHPFSRLASHIFESFFDLGFLTDTGADAFGRVLIGVVSILITLGMLLARIYLAKYRGLSVAATAIPYERALRVDETTMIALAMLMVAMATVLISRSLFPSETDFRVLVPLPLARATIFGARLAALLTFLAIFIAAISVSGALFILVSHTRWSAHPLVFRLLAHAATGAAACLWSALAVAAAFGVASLTAPRNGFQMATGGMQTLLVCALVLLLPVVFQLPAQEWLFDPEATLALAVPPAWFLGLERVLLGERDPLLVQLAAIGAGMSMAVTLVVGGCYAYLSRHFDHVLTRPDLNTAGRWWRRRAARPPRMRVRPAQSAIAAFTAITLRRSALHRGVFAAAVACALGFVVNSLVGAGLIGWLRYGGEAGRGLWAAVAWAPFPLMFAAVFAIRASLALPIEERANWMFRMTETDATRRPQLDAVIHTVILLGVVMPLALLTPLQWLMFGRRALLSLGASALCGLALVELVLVEWRRLPFSSGYMPGKRFLGLTVLLGFAGVTIFSVIGMGIARSVLLVGSRRSLLILFTILFLIVAALRWRRHRTWGRLELLFEDELPENIQPLRLH